MRDYIIRRLLLGLITLWIISVVVFGLVRFIGDPILAMIEPGASMGEIQALRERWGLNKPLIFQYGVFIGRAARGDFGTSIAYKRPALDLFLQALPNTLYLGATAFALAVVFGLTLGLLSPLKVGGFFDTFGKVFAFMGLAIPGFWLALMFILVFGVFWGILPVSGMGGIRHLIMPATCLALYNTAAFVRLSRSSLLEVLGTDYIKFLRIKGVPEWLVVGRHALRNALIPVISYGGVQLAIMLGGSIAIEIVFAWPGVGLLLYQALMQRDYPLVQTPVLMTATIVVMMNLIVDILYAYIDPRIRLK
jgi:ABC-type dipeptide/oligopeptide/nickel transport system permease component